MSALIETGISQREACRSTGTARASWNRWRKPPAPGILPFCMVRSGPQPHALTAQERKSVLEVCNSDRFCNSAPRAIVATLLDEGQYLASVSSFYRILRAHELTRERRAIASHPPRVKPELVTTGPNQLWSWDVTKLAGPAKWTWYSLYLVLDVFSRYIVGWEVASTESTAIAKTLFREAVGEQGIAPGQLHIHADGGAMMKAKSLALLFADLGISKSHSRPHTSNDNPYSEAQFKTLKYRPEFPAFFPSLHEARVFMADFVRWYNHQHRHSGLAFLTPADVHYGHDRQVLEKRNAAMQQVWLRHPRRFHPSGPANYALAKSVYINRPPIDQSDATHKPANDQCLTNV